MVEALDSDHYVGTHIWFQFVSDSESGRTKIWRVRDKDNVELGEIKWFGRWRKYSFFPCGKTVYEQICLRELAEFIEEMTRLHRTRKKAGSDASPTA